MKTTKIILSTIAVLCLTACSDYFSPDAENTVKTGDNIVTQRAAFYQMNGILSCLQDLGDSYVVKGELRGDLMTTTVNSTQDLHDIEEFAADSTNAYSDQRKLYKLINNCNYAINKLDTSIIVKGEKVLCREMAQAKSIRAWAYLQLCLDYGQAYYYTEPMLDADAKSEGEYMTLDPLTSTLIDDLTPYLPASGTESENLPEYGTISSVSSNLLFMPIRFMLGELYMWKQDFGKAAEMYYELILNRKMTTSTGYNNSWNSATMDSRTTRWSNQYTTVDSTNFASIIAFNPTTGYSTGLTAIPSLCSYRGSYMLAPSATAISNWNDQTYCFTAGSVTTGDLRGFYGSYGTTTTSDITDYYISKYDNCTVSSKPYLILSRSSLVWLRFAEALNRLGKREMAFAILKYGLNQTTMENESYISATEKTGENFTDFGQITSNRASVFASNGALHDRGCGRSNYNSNFVITGETAQDSMRCVEDFIMEEYALECAFEGNRFHDLMRVATYRNDPSYLADKVASKFAVGKQESIRAKLLDKRSWQLY